MPPTPRQQPAGPLKRKQQDQPSSSSRSKKRVKIQDARTIATQTTGRAFGNGEVDVDKFLKSREFEIRAIEDSMKRAKKSLSARAFQNVPRDLRRRTASHDVKRVPKRLRVRATKEMAEDNTPTVNSKTRKPSAKSRLRMDTVKSLKSISSNAKEKEKSTSSDSNATTKSELHAEAKGASQLSERHLSHETRQVKPRTPRVKKNTLLKPPKPKAKFRKRQIHKTWLPTHLFHAKRAHMTPPKEALWRMAIPLSPTVKSYRSTHRASSESGAIAWDMSYMSTIGLEGPEKSIKSMLHAVGVGAEEGDDIWQASERWIRGTRSWNSWLCERDGWPRKCIAPATVVWCAVDNNCEHEIAKEKEQTPRKPKVKRRAFVRVHPSAFLKLWNELLKASKIQQPPVTVEDLRFEIGSIKIMGPASTEALVGTLQPLPKPVEETGGNPFVEGVWSSLKTVTNPASLPANVVIALSVSDPRLHNPPRKERYITNEHTQQQLMQTLSIWPAGAALSSPSIFDRSSRLEASRRLPTQKAINRRKAMADPGSVPEPVSTDPKIPVYLIATKTKSQTQGSWTVLLPWKCVLPVWYSLMYYPLSSGGNVRFGGLNQTKQIAFETSEPWFPGDYPGTAAGWDWEASERERRKKEWQKRPKGKRIEWESVNLGNDRKGEIGLGWACHWENLLRDQEDTSVAKATFYHLPASEASKVLRRPTSLDNATLKGALVTVNLTVISRGVPAVCGRIYRIPLKDIDLRRRWLALSRPEKSKSRHDLQPVKPPADAPLHIQRQYLAASLLAEQSRTSGAVDNETYSMVPHEEDLIGFVTTGSFNLGEGKGTGVGCLLLQKTLERASDEVTENDTSQLRADRLCIIRAAGEAHGRLARWALA